MNQRIREIDISRGMAIIFIVLGHILVHCDELYRIFKVIYGFHVPLFFIISGMVFSCKKPFGEFVKAKFMRIMVPYFFFAIVFLVPYHLFGTGVSSELGVTAHFSIAENLKSILYGVGEGARLKQNSSLWFLPVLFVMELMFYCIGMAKQHIKKEAGFILVLLMIAAGCFVAKTRIILPWGISSALTLGIFMEIGILLKQHNIMEKLSFSIISLLCCIIALLAGIGIVDNNLTFDCANYNYGSLIKSFLGATLLCMVVLMISKWIGKNKVLEYIGRNTMGILVFHKLLIVVFQSKLGRISTMLCEGTALEEGLLCLAVATATIFISLVATRITRAICPVVLGEKRRTNEKD